MTAFYLAMFIATHAVTTSYRVLGGSWNSLDTFVVANGIMLIPGITAIVFARWQSTDRLWPSLGLTFAPNRWWLFAWLVPSVLMLAVLGVSLLMPGTSFDPTMTGLGPRLGFSVADTARLRGQIGFLGLPPLAGFLAQGLVLGPTLGLVGALGEEVAWRGWLYRELTPLGFWRCSLVTGLLWGLWHVPITLQGYGYPDHPVLGTLVAIAYVLLFTPLLTLLRLRAGSVIAPAILHGTADATVLLTLALVRGGNDLTTGWGSLSCLPVLAAVDVWVAISVAGQSARRVRETPRLRE